MEIIGILVLAAAGLGFAAVSNSGDDTRVKTVKLPDTGKNDFYIGNRKPLAPDRFRKLPVGAVQPRGWVRRQLELQAEGFIGRLTEISPWLKKENNAWLSPTGKGEHGWEEVPYWLKGFGDTGYLLGDKRIIGEAKVWVEGMIKSQQPDGWFGPASNKTFNKGAPDMWPNMVALNCLQTYYEYSGDKRVLDLMSKYFRYQLSVPEDQMFLSYWEKHRGGDNISSVYWLYNRTGGEWMLDLVHKIHRHTAPWEKDVPDWHGVNIPQAIREPLQVSVLTGNAAQAEATERNYQKIRHMYGQVPGGLYGADENARYGFHDPRQAAETCAMVEMMLTHEMLLGLTGEAKWAERCEDVAFNSLPASMTDDLKALRYLTAPNHAVSDAPNKAPGIQNGGPMYLMDPKDHRCCQHNVSHGWPYFAEHLWFATAGNGLGVALYGPSAVTAKVGKGETVTIEEETRYPFSDKITFRFKTKRPVAFPLTLRLPSWTKNPSLRLNGKPLALGAGDYALVERTWFDGDVLELQLPMSIGLQTWEGNHNSVSVQRGPLTYSLNIGETRRQYGNDGKWPAWEILPTTPWNYGLDPTATMEVRERPWPADNQPFAYGAAPVEIVAKGRKIPEWKLDVHGLAALLQPSPAFTAEPEESITLVPMGSARLRIAAFPTVSSESSAHRWEEPKMPKPGVPATASHKHPADSYDALTDGLEPKHSADLLIPRFTWWDHKGTSEWVELNYPEEKRFSEVEVYWFDDGRTGGGCRVPASWRLVYFADGVWQMAKAKGPYGTEQDVYNKVPFEAASSKQWRIEVQLQPNYSGGILEWVLR